MNPAEFTANLLNTVSIILAGRNSVHTWWTGIVGCAVFCWVFFSAKLYADSMLQIFFIAASVGGWWNWRARADRPELPVRKTPLRPLVLLGIGGIAVAAGYSLLLVRFTDAAAPVPDSVVLAFSVLGQFLLMARRIETWWCWLIVNTIAVPLFASRGLWITAVLYGVYWINAVIALRVWRRKISS
jgi:nicotinamide mononucleotide transporter